MSAFTLENPVFATYVVTASLIILKLMGQGWMTVYRMIRAGGGYVSPEDLRPGLINRAPDQEQLETDDYVERSRRMHRNDLENLPGFLVAGLLFTATGPSPLLASILMWGFVGARAGHAVAYASAASHEIRATFYTVGSLIVIAMAALALVAAL